MSEGKHYLQPLLNNYLYFSCHSFVVFNETFIREIFMFSRFLYFFPMKINYRRPEKCLNHVLEVFFLFDFMYINILFNNL